MGNKACVLAITILAGCVTRRDYGELQHEFEDARQTLQGLDAQKTQVDAALAEEKMSVAQLKGETKVLRDQIRSLQVELEAMRAERDGHAEELASALKDRSKLETSVEDMKLALSEAARREQAAKARVAEYRKLLASFKTLIAAGKVKVQFRKGRMVLQLPTDILFGSGSASLSEEGRTALAEVGAVLAGLGRELQIEGHTDDVPIKTASFPSNWELGSARALAVLRTLREVGVDGDMVSAATYGEFEPAAPNDSPEGRAQNRRIEIVLVPDLSLLPGGDELTQLGKG